MFNNRIDERGRVGEPQQRKDVLVFYRGQTGMLVKREAGPMLFAADSMLHRASLRDGRPPGNLTRFITDDLRMVQTTIDRLVEFARLRPEVAIVPTHCPEAYREYIGEQP